jgi:hypothetical protein
MMFWRNILLTSSWLSSRKPAVPVNGGLHIGYSCKESDLFIMPILLLGVASELIRADKISRKIQ